MNSRHLAVEISTNAVRFVSIRDGVVLHRLEKPYTGKTDREMKESLSQLFSDTNFLKEEFEEISLAWCIDRSTLVPNAIFNESSALDIFQLCFGKDAVKHEVDYNRIHELSVINVYQIPDWIKSFFVIKYPRVVIQHAGTHIVRKSLSENAFKLKASIICYETYFRLAIVKHNNLEFYSSFSYQSAEDIIYQLNFALQQKEMTGEKGTIELVGSVGSDSNIINQVESGLGKIGDLKKMEIINDADYLAKSQLLCV